jgi:hypothetical protein
MALQITLRISQTTDSILCRPVQLVIPLEIDQGGENVEDWNIFPLNFSNELSMIMFSLLFQV